MNKNIMKLFRDLMKLGKVETDNGTLIYEGDVLSEGTEVFVEDEGGNIVPAPDGTYGEYEVKDGKIITPEPTEPEVEPEVEVEQEEVEEPTEPEVEPTEPEVEDLTPRIEALENLVAELQARLDAMTEKKEEEEFKSLKPAEKEIKDVVAHNKGALKYFDK